MFGAIEEFVVAVAGKVCGFLEVCLDLCAAEVDIGFKQLGGDEWCIKHLAYDRKRLRCKTA